MNGIVSPERFFKIEGSVAPQKIKVGFCLAVLKENFKVGSKGIPIGIPSYQVGGGVIHRWCLSVMP